VSSRGSSRLGQTVRGGGVQLRGAGRLVLWLAVAVVLVRGMAAIVAGPEPADRRVPAAERGGVSDDEARAFAVRFVHAYLAPSSRGQITRFLADGLSDRVATVPPRSPGASVASTTVAREVSLGGSRALITVAALTSDGTSRYLTVPVERDRHGGLAVSALPSFSPPPPRAADEVEDVDPLTGRGAGAIGGLVRRFLREYLSGADSGQLAYLLAPDATVTPMPPGLAVVSIDALDEIAGAPGRGRRTVLASVSVRDRRTGAAYPLSYRIDIGRRDRWHVVAVAGGPQS
jgi:hypothetical protein